MGNFTVRTAQIGVEMQKAERRERLLRVHDDPVAKGYLKDAADAFVLALGYAELFSPRNTTMTSTYTYETIYNYLKKFNEQELEDFNAYQVETSKLYQIKQIKPENLADLGDFLHECFGLGE